MDTASEVDTARDNPTGSLLRRPGQALWFIPHTIVVYAIAKYVPIELSAWTRNTLLPLLQHPTSSGSFEFLFSNLLAFTFIPASLIGLINVRLRHKAAEFVWVVPALILIYKIVTFPASSVLQNQHGGAFHHYFGGGFLIPEFRDWRDFWSIVATNPDMTRGMDQLKFAAPFYVGIGYSLAALVSRHIKTTTRTAEDEEVKAVEN